MSLATLSADARVKVVSEMSALVFKDREMPRLRLAQLKMNSRAMTEGLADCVFRDVTPPSRPIAPVTKFPARLVFVPQKQALKAALKNPKALSVLNKVGAGSLIGAGALTVFAR